MDLRNSRPEPSHGSIKGSDEKVLWDLDVDNARHDSVSGGNRCFLSPLGCHGLNEVLLNSSSVATVRRPDAGQSRVLWLRMFMSSVLS